MNNPATIPTPDGAIDTIRAILSGPMACPRMTAFGPEARLGPDLGLDSTALMSLMLHLEDAGIPMPEAAFDQAPDMTIGTMAHMLSGTTPATEEPVDIKVHCVVSSFCQALKDKGGIDHRPMYLGLWDGQIVVDDRNRLSYHATDIDHGFYLHWFRHLFGITVTRWYDEAAGKAENLSRLDRQIAAWQPGRYIMPMVDMFLLPQRENKFAQDPFPHYALIEPTDTADEWLMRDPDFRWEGRLPAHDLRRAFARDTVAGGFAFSTVGAHPASRAAITEMFHATFDPARMPLIDALDDILAAHEGANRADLEPALREVPVIAIRKYAYEHAFAIFGDIEGDDRDAFEECCDRIAALHAGFGTVQRRAVAYARKGRGPDLSAARSELARLRDLESGIKSDLLQWFERWDDAGRKMP